MTQNLQPTPFSTRRLSAEQRLVLLLTGQMFFTALALSLLEIVGQALLLTDFGSDSLPYVYIVTGAAVSLFAAGYATLQRRWVLPKVATATLIVLVAFFLFAWVARAQLNWRWISFALMVALPMGYQLNFIIVGGQAGQLFDVRQMKRLFPTVLTGLSVGFMVGGLILPVLRPLLGNSTNLLLVAMVSMGLSLLLLRLTVRQFGAQFAPASASSGTKKATQPLTHLLRSPYTRLIFAYQMLSAIGTQLVLFIFLDRVQVVYPNVDDLAEFFGYFTVVLNVLLVGFLAAPAGYLLNRFGLRFGITANPFVIGLIVALLVVLGALLGLAASPFFWLVVSGRILDIVLSVGTTNPSLKAMYQALPEQERPLIETTVEGIGVPVAIGLSGVLLVLFNLIPALSFTHLILLTVVVTALWVLAGLAVYRGYRGALVKTISRRALTTADFSLEDGSTLTVLEAMLNSPKPHDVAMALDLLSEADYPQLDERLIGLLQHETAVVRQEALKRLEDRRVEAALPAVQALLAQEKEEIVLGTAVRTLASLSPVEHHDQIKSYLSDNLSETTIGAMVGLLRYGGISGVLAAGHQLTALETSSNPTNRQIVAQIIGEVGIDSFFQPLLPLLQDPDNDVRRAALVSAAQVPHPRLLPHVIDNLANPLTRSAAMSALQATGEHLLPTVAAALAGETDQGEEAIIRMVRVCGQLKGQQVIDTLKPHIDHPDNDVQLAVLSALHLAGYRAVTAAETAEIERTLRGEVAHALRLLLTKQALGETDLFTAVHRALDYEYAEARQRSFLLLSFSYDSEAILRAEEQLLHSQPASQALALETLDVTLTSQQKQLIFPLVDAKLTPAQQIQQLQAVFPLKSLSQTARLKEIIADPDGEWTNGWTRACVLQVVGKLGLTELVDVVEAALRIEEHPVQETAVWALHTLAPERLKKQQAKLQQAPNPQVQQLAEKLQGE